ncbi:MAG: helix-turn-helix domain-containing protein [Phycisphaerales bacterium]|nr:helix-turn-helix domain-containing protein [Phycisphaerales bacterium]
MATKSQHALIYLPVPSFLRTLREQAGLTQRQLAQRIGRPHTWVHGSEIGSRRVDIAEFVLFCQGCDVDPCRTLKHLMQRP